MKGKRNQPNTTLSQKGDPQQYSRSATNIGNLAIGKIDTIITSPPFKTANQGGGLNKKPPKTFRGVLKNHSLKLSKKPENVDNMKYGDITIITSPPYAEQMQAKSDYKKRKQRLIHKGFTRKTHGLLRGQKHTSSIIGGDTRYSHGTDNIGNLKHGNVDVVLTSPPFASTSVAKTFKSEKELEKFAREQYVFKHGRSLEATKRYIRKSWQGYPDNPNNIGQLPYPVDTILTSPPFGVDPKNQRHKSLQQFDEERGFKSDRSFRGAYGTLENLDQANISTLRDHGKVDTIITSPPFADGLSNKNLDWKRQIERMRQAGVSEERIKTFLGEANVLRDNMGAYSKDPNNIGNLPLGPVDAVLTSPPYANTSQNSPQSKGWEKLAQDPSSNRFGRKSHPSVGVEYSTNPENIGNLPYEPGSNPGQISAILTSPPFARTKGGLTGKRNLIAKIRAGQKPKSDFGGINTIPRPCSDDPNNIENLIYRPVDAVLTSPPYASGGWKADENPQNPIVREAKRKALFPMRPPDNRFSDNCNNIQNLPYSEATASQTGEEGLLPILSSKMNDANMKRHQKAPINGIIILKPETYLEAMLKVYRGMYDVLKPGGLCIIVLKNFIRHWKVVDLIADTEKLCEHVGFTLIKRIKFELPHVSFWRLNYRSQWARKFPGKPFPIKEFESVYKYETALVFQKPV